MRLIHWKYAVVPVAIMLWAPQTLRGDESQAEKQGNRQQQQQGDECSRTASSRVKTHLVISPLAGKNSKADENRRHLRRKCKPGRLAASTWPALYAGTIQALPTGLMTM